MQRKSGMFKLVLLIGLAAGGVIAVAGNLNPPAGLVAPTHKTLTDVEPRVAINATNTPGDADSVFRITQAGSYYLTGNIAGVAAKSCIEVEVVAPGAVSIDLAGFQIIGTGASLPGVFVAEGGGNVTPITIRNGRIHGGNYAIRALAATSSVVENVHVTGSTIGILCGANALVRGCTVRGVGSTAGIMVGGNSIVEHCISESNSGDGIRTDRSCIVRDCVSNNNTGNGITPFFADRLTVERCVCTGNGGNGVQVDDYGAVRQCTAAGNTLDGIEAQDGGTITDCSATQNGQDGIEVSDRCHVVGNTCDGNGASSVAAGIQATGSDSRIEGNFCSNADKGIDVDGAGNIIVRNTCTGNTTNNWEFVANNVFGPIVDRTAPASPAVAGNTAVDSTATTHPNANFTY
ncbi:MAG TPA: right-handed parallel beta-helix repeat-containing protein [Phycisphaerae bacterium]|nr:right-handed parallel beta-helix repeat-containing protein [Phycisphaerae bacterium]